MNFDAYNSKREEIESLLDNDIISFEKANEMLDTAYLKYLTESNLDILSALKDASDKYNTTMKDINKTANKNLEEAMDRLDELKEYLKSMDNYINDIEGDVAKSKAATIILTSCKAGIVGFVGSLLNKIFHPFSKQKSINSELQNKHPNIKKLNVVSSSIVFAAGGAIGATIKEIIRTSKGVEDPNAFKAKAHKMISLNIQAIDRLKKEYSLRIKKNINIKERYH